MRVLLSQIAYRNNRNSKSAFVCEQRERERERERNKNPTYNHDDHCEYN